MADHCEHRSQSILQIKKLVFSNEALQNVPISNVMVNGHKQPLLIKIRVSIEAIPQVNVQTMAFTIAFMLKQYWVDQRLQLEGLKNVTDPHCYFTVPSKYAQAIWLPKTTFTGTLHKQVIERSLKISAYGQVDYQQKIILSTVCAMHLKYFPMDRQMCGLSMTSFNYHRKMASLVISQGKLYKNTF